MSEEISLNQIEELAALPADVASGFAYVSAKNGELVLGEARTFNNSRVELGPGSEYRLPKGYYLENNVIVTSSTANSTSATATAADIMLGKTAWVNGVKITGTARGFANLAQSTATPGDILKTKTAYNSNGDQLIGTIETRANGYAIDIDSAYSYSEWDNYTQNIVFFGPKKQIKFKPGYYPNLTFKLPDLSKVTAGPGDILKGKSTVYRVDNSTVELREGTLDLNQKIKEEVKANTTLTAEDLLANKKGYNRDGNVVTGTIQNVTNTSAIVLGDSNNSYTIPKGFHDGTGKVIYNPATTAPTTATADNIILGKTAIGKNGEFVTGTILNKGNVHVDFGPADSGYSPTYSAYKVYYESITINDKYAEFFEALDEVPEDMVPSPMRFTDTTMGFKVGKATKYTNQPETILNGTNKTYTIPKGFHDGNGIVKLKLEKTPLAEPEKYKDCTPENTPINQIYFNQDGEMKTGKLSLATYESHPSGRSYLYIEPPLGSHISLNDSNQMNRWISFMTRYPENSDSLSKLKTLNTLGMMNAFNRKFPQIGSASQYNKDNSEEGYTVFAIPTDVEQWGYRSYDFNKQQSIVYKIEPTNSVIKPNALNTKIASGTPWFSNMLVECINSHKTPIIDDIVIKIRKITNVDKFEGDCIYEFSIPYIPQDNVNLDYLKKCMDATTVLHDGLVYNSSADVDNYKIYATFSEPFIVNLYHFKGFSTYTGGNFSITFHVYNKRTNDYTYERDPAFKTDYVMRQLGFWINSSTENNAPQDIIPIEISFRNIHM
jgi:hypothetical protein